MIHALLDTTQAIGTVEIDKAIHEICAEAIASHDRHSNHLTVNLRAFMRATKHDRIGTVSLPAWLPVPEIITEQVGEEEAHEL